MHLSALTMAILVSTSLSSLSFFFDFGGMAPFPTPEGAQQSTTRLLQMLLIPQLAAEGTSDAMPSLAFCVDQTAQQQLPFQIPEADESGSYYSTIVCL